MKQELKGASTDAPNAAQADTDAKMSRWTTSTPLSPSGGGLTGMLSSIGYYQPGPAGSSFVKSVMDSRPSPRTHSADRHEYRADQSVQYGDAPVEPKEDIINRPKHYTTGAIETWDYIVSQKLGYLEGNVIKYVSRYKHKNGLEDLKKAQAYLNKLISEYK